MHIEKFRFAKGGCRDKNVPSEVSVSSATISGAGQWNFSSLGYDSVTPGGRLLTAGGLSFATITDRGSCCLTLQQIGNPMTSIMAHGMVPAITLIVAISVVLFASAYRFLPL